MGKYLKLLFFCGIVSSLLYICTDILTGLSWSGYSFFSQTVSELSAIGAPTRPIWVLMTFIYNPLLIAFGVGVLKFANKKSALYSTGILLIVWGILGFFWLLAPMHLRGSIGSNSDTMHLVMTGVTVTLMTILIVVGSFALGKLFRIYSYLTILTMMVFGILTGQQTSRVVEQLPTPWMGITERLCSYSPLIWVIVLAFILLSKNDLTSKSNTVKRNTSAVK